MREGGVNRVGRHQASAEWSDGLWRVYGRVTEKTDEYRLTKTALVMQERRPLFFYASRPGGPFAPPLSPLR